jgi:hypothetical protein
MTPRHVPRGLLPESASKPIEQYGEGRVCWYPSCDTRLSRYNEDEGCALHPADPIVKQQLRIERGRFVLRDDPDDAAPPKTSRDGEP